VCSALTASSTCARSITQETLIEEVLIISILL